MLRRVRRWMFRRLLNILLICSITVFTTWNIVDIYMHRILERAGLTDEIGRVELTSLLAYVAMGDAGQRKRDDDRSPFDRIMQLQDEDDVGNIEDGEYGEAVPVFGQLDSGGRSGAEGSGEKRDDGDSAMNDWNQENDRLRSESQESGSPDFDGDSAMLEGLDGEFSMPGNGQASSDEELHGRDEGSLIWDGDDLAFDDEIVMTTEEFMARQNLLTEEDKIAIFTMLFTKLPQHEFQNLSYWLEDGVTKGEMEDIYRMLGQYLTKEELEQLTKIIQKYE